MPKDTDFPCPYCEYKSKYRGNVSQHVKVVHEKRRDFKCSMCHYAASQRKALSQHIKSVHEHVKDQVCGKCDFTCSYKSNLIQHMQGVHEEIRDHECPKCGKKFKRSLHLLGHIDTIHGRSKNTQEKCPDKKDHITETICQICGFKSSKVSELARHAMEQCATEHWRQTLEGVAILAVTWKRRSVRRRASSRTGWQFNRKTFGLSFSLKNH